MKTESTPRDWTPVLLAGQYCSPACGGRCTKAAYDSAVIAADSLALKLGSGFKPRVWENLGWHFAAERGNCQVHPPHKTDKDSEYTCYLNTNPQFVTRNTDPCAAVAEAYSGLSAHIQGLQLSLNENTPADPQ